MFRMTHHLWSKIQTYPAKGQQTTIDKQFSHGEICYTDEGKPTARPTIIKSIARIEDNIPYVKKEFER